MPAHPQFWQNCLPNEEQIEKPKNSFLGIPKNPKKPKNFSKKCVWTIRKPPKQITQWSKNWSIRLLWYANIKKASQDEQQNQTTTTTTNTTYIKKFMSVLKNKN